MGVAGYVDAILGLLERAGVTADEISENRTEQKLVHGFMKGVDFEVAARAICRQHGVEIIENGSRWVRPR